MPTPKTIPETRLKSAMEREQTGMMSQWLSRPARWTPWPRRTRQPAGTASDRAHAAAGRGAP